MARTSMPQVHSPANPRRRRIVSCGEWHNGAIVEESFHPYSLCHPERRNCFAERSNFAVEEPALSEAEGTPTPLPPPRFRKEFQPLPLASCPLVQHTTTSRIFGGTQP